MTSGSKPAALPLFGDAYLADTTHLTTEEHGAYFLLLLAAWRQADCALPADDRKLARIAGLSLRKWAAIKPTIMDFWQVEDGRIFQSRLRKEHAWVCKKSESNCKSAAARWGKQPPEKPKKGGMRTQCEGNAPPPPPKEEPKGSSPPTPQHVSGKDWPEIPEWIPVEEWNGFVAMRRKQRRDPTPRAIKLIIATLTKLQAEGHEPGKVLDQSTVKNWLDLYPIKENYHGQEQPARDNRDGLQRYLDEKLGVGEA